MTEETEVGPESIPHEGYILAGDCRCEDIFIRIAGRPVNQDGRTINGSPIREFRKEASVCLGEYAAGPVDCLPGKRVKIVRFFESGCNPVVITHDAGNRSLPDNLDTFVRPRIISDDISETECPLDV